MANYEEMINKMYDSQLSSQKETLESDFQVKDADLVAQKEKNQRAADSGMRATAVAADRATVSNAELQNASGLSSGARARVQQAKDNKLHSDLASIRAAQMEADADVERQRGLLAQEYASAIRQAQADNDLARAQALYQEAKDQENKQLQSQLYSDSNEAARRSAELAAAKLIGDETGDYTKYWKLLGLSDAEIAALTKTKSVDPDGTDYTTENYQHKSNQLRDRI